jgi:hypothetical protein
VTLSISILRHRLYAIDLIINRALSAAANAVARALPSEIQPPRDRTR